MNRTALTARLVLVAAAIASLQAAGAAKSFFPESQIPAFNIPKMAAPPTVDGTIDPDEWKSAVRIMGMTTAHSNTFRGRPHAFWVAWDEQHLYIAGRAHVLKGHILYKSKRAKFTTQTVFDDAYEFGLSMEGRNQSQGEAASFFKFILNFLESGEYLKMYPSIGQYLYNWRPEMDIANRLYEDDDAQWWEIELALDLEDLQMPVQNKAGDPVRILLAHDGKNPGWQWTCVPSASGYLVHDGYPRGMLTSHQPYVQVEQLDGLHDERIDLRSVIQNPTDSPVKVQVHLQIRNEQSQGQDDIKATIGPSVDRVLDIPANASVRFDFSEAFPGFIYGTHPEHKRSKMRGTFDWQVTLAGAPDAKPVYRYFLAFAKDAEKKHLHYTAQERSFNMQVRYNPVNHKVWVEADTLDAQLPEGTTAEGASWELRQGERPIAQGTIETLVYHKYQDLIQLPELTAGKYEVAVSLADADGKPLLTRTADIEKKDEAKEFPEWWNKTYGNPEQLLRPFQALRVEQSRRQHSTLVRCARRTYTLNSLGLPNAIQAADGEVLTEPARLVVTVGGVEHVVPVTYRLKFTERKDWRVSFEGPPSEAAGVRFQARGIVEQDGLVSLELTYEPAGKPVPVQELRIEWPVDDTWGNRMACMGVGGNYSARFIGAVPPGQGEVWSSLEHIGQAGSGMTVGNFYQNVWIGTEKRGLLWWANSDEGWVPNDRTAAHSIVREGAATLVRNHLISTYPGQTPFALDARRTVRFSYNASPFRALTPGWRVNQRSAANGFTEKPKYKWNWDTGTEHFSILSPPFKERSRWEEYYAHCQEVATKRSVSGIYDAGVRMRPYLTNQIALRGYMRKSLESDIYNYFSADWETTDSGETLNKSYQDYMMWLQHRQVAEGGCRHFYYDISMCGRVSRQLVAGMGYILPDGRIQPSGTDATLRDWYIRANALMQEKGIYPTGISGHATQTIPLVALPFSDAILDSEFPMKDPIDVYPTDRMIALSCPHSFGCNINHLGFMNPDWAGLHDAGMGGGHASIFDRAEWRNWGIERADVEFIPYWRNRHVVRRIGSGLICSIWKRPRQAGSDNAGSLILGIMNYGPDQEGFERSRPCELMLDLAALGIPAHGGGEQVRLSELTLDHRLPERYITHLKWWEKLPGEPAKYDKKRIVKYAPPVTPVLDLTTGALTGFDVFYHHQRYVIIHWDGEPIEDAAWNEDLAAELRSPALDWGINTAVEVTDTGCITSDTQDIRLRAWHRAVRPGSAVDGGSVMLLIHNASEEGALARVSVDIEALNVKVTPDRLWQDFTSLYKLAGPGGLRNVIWTDEFAETKKHLYMRGDLVYDGHQGLIVGLLQPGEKRLVSIDRY